MPTTRSQFRNAQTILQEFLQLYGFIVVWIACAAGFGGSFQKIVQRWLFVVVINIINIIINIIVQVLDYYLDDLWGLVVFGRNGTASSDDRGVAHVVATAVAAHVGLVVGVIGFCYCITYCGVGDTTAATKLEVVQ